MHLNQLKLLKSKKYFILEEIQPSRYTAGFFYAFFVLELCSDKKGHKKNLNKIEVLWNLGGERGIRTPVSFH